MNCVAPKKANIGEKLRATTTKRSTAFMSEAQQASGDLHQDDARKCAHNFLVFASLAHGLTKIMSNTWFARCVNMIDDDVAECVLLVFYTACDEASAKLRMPTATGPGGGLPTRSNVIANELRVGVLLRLKSCLALWASFRWGQRSACTQHTGKL